MQQPAAKGDPEAAKIKNPVASTPDSIAAGKKTFATSALPATATEGKGGIVLSVIEDQGGKQPPDLTDDKWDHGSSDGEIFTVVKKGVAPDFFMAPFDGRIRTPRSGTWSTTSSRSRRRSETAAIVDPHEPAQPPPEDAPRVSAPAVIAALVLGAIIGGMAVEYWLTRAVLRPEAQTPAPRRDLAADVAHLKTIVPTQSHTMLDVGYHWANLWFAVEKKNWPLARYFFDEARQAIRWTVLIRPVRQLSDGGTVDVKGIFDAIDISAFATVQTRDRGPGRGGVRGRVQADARGVPQLPRRLGEAVPAPSRSRRPRRRR